MIIALQLKQWHSLDSDKCATHALDTYIYIYIYGRNDTFIYIPRALCVENLRFPNLCKLPTMTGGDKPTNIYNDLPARNNDCYYCYCYLDNTVSLRNGSQSMW